MHRPASQVAAELVACIRCNECLNVCPALPSPLSVAAVNRQTLNGPVSPEVARFAQNCVMCGACVPVCPVGLHRDAMMLWLKMRLLQRNVRMAAPLAETDAETDTLVDDLADVPARAFRPATHHWPSHEAARTAPRTAPPHGRSVMRQRVELGPRPLRTGRTHGEGW